MKKRAVSAFCISVLFFMFIFLRSAESGSFSSFADFSDMSFETEAVLNVPDGIESSGDVSSELDSTEGGELSVSSETDDEKSPETESESTSEAERETVREPEITVPPAPETTSAPETSRHDETERETIPSVAPSKPKTAEEYADSLSLEMQVAQLFFVRCPSSGAVDVVRKYCPGGYILFGRDFDGKTPSDVKADVRSYQNAAKVPMLIGVDEEGGSVVRVSSHPAFRTEKFKSPSELYALGGIPAIVSDAREKDKLLLSLGINVNLAPVCDISTDPSDFIYKRSLGQSASVTCDYVSAVTAQMRSDGIGCSLKHFPGYGSNKDTHKGIAIDNRSLDSFRENDFLPFKTGISAGAGSVMVSHNIMCAVDSQRPASLSPAVHNILRGELGFGGVVMTDDISMGAIIEYTGNNSEESAVMAVLAGNDMLISSDFVRQYNAVLSAVRNGRISRSAVRASVIRVISWKTELGIMN